jgi:hypothetical protein
MCYRDNEIHSDHVSRYVNCSTSADPTCARRVGTVGLKQVLVVGHIKFSATNNHRAFLSSLMFSFQSVDLKFQGLPSRLMHLCACSSAFRFENGEVFIGF